MSEQSATPQPQLGTVVRIQQKEIDQLNNNKIYLMSLLDEYQQEVGRLLEVIATTKANHDAEHEHDVSSNTNAASNSHSS